MDDLEKGPWGAIDYDTSAFFRGHAAMRYAAPPCLEMAEGQGDDQLRVPLFASYLSLPQALFLGVFSRDLDGTHIGKPYPVLNRRPGHLLTIAPTRAGKGAGQIVPSLLNFHGSALVVDIKGENHALTAAYRAESQEFTDLHRAVWGEGAESRVYRFAPFEDDTACFNPLDFIREGADAYDDARMIAEMLIPTKPHSGGEDYWDIEARNALSALLLFVVEQYRAEGQATLRTLLGVCMAPGETVTGPDGKPVEVSGLMRLLGMMQEAGSGIPAQWAAMFEGYADRVRANIWGSMMGYLQIWQSPRLLAATDRSDFRFEDLKREDGATTIYLCFPPAYLHSHRPVLRVMVGLAVSAMTRPGLPVPEIPVTFFLDEMPSLGYMGPLMDAQAYLAGYGVKLWAFAQNIGQMRAVYGDAWQTFPANADVLCVFGLNDLETSQWISELLGETDKFLEYYQHATTHARPLNPTERAAFTFLTCPKHDDSLGNGMPVSLRQHLSNMVVPPEVRDNVQRLFLDHPDGEAERIIDEVRQAIRENKIVAQTGEAIYLDDTPQEAHHFTSERVAAPYLIRENADVILAFGRGKKPLLLGLAPYYQLLPFASAAGRWTP